MMSLLAFVALLWTINPSKNLRLASAAGEVEETHSLVSYPCPKACDCFLRHNPFHIDVACGVDILDDDKAFRTLNQTDIPSRISIRCDKWDIRSSRLVDGIFESLHAFYSIKVKDCHLTDVSREAFRGLKSLKVLVIESGVNTRFDKDCLQLPELSKVEIVSLTETGMTVAPRLCNLDNLWYVNLTGNSIKRFQDTGMVCANQSHIEVIDISGNYIRDLPERLANVSTQIGRLSAARNKIFSIKETVFDELADLLIVDLTANKISSFPRNVFIENTKIHTLEIGNNIVGHFPGRIFSTLRDITLLRLSRMNLNSDIWNEIMYLTKLQVLFLNGNHIEYFDVGVIKNLTNLGICDISENRLKNIPNRTFEFNNGMILFNASWNKINYINEDAFRGMPALYSLDLKENQIYGIHSDALSHLTSLNILNISSNMIESLPKFPSSLVVLDLRRNNIVAIDNTSFSNMNALQGINMMSNRLTYIPHQTFETNTNLKLLQIAYNDISDIEYDAFGQSSYLENLILHHNYIYELAFLRYTAFGFLKVIDLSHNKIRALTSNLFPSKIEEIFLDGNYIEFIEGYTFKMSSKLRYVSLKMNQLSTLTKVALDVAEGNLMQVNYRLVGNPYLCDCKLEWLKQLSELQNTYSLGPYIIRDISSLYCSKLAGFRNIGFKSGLMKHIPTTSFLCEYTTHCVDCQDSKSNTCCYTCPDGCMCYCSNNWDDANVIDCLKAELTAIPLNISIGVTVLELSGNVIKCIMPDSFAKLSRLRELYLNSSHVYEIRAGSFENLTHLVDLDISNNFLRVLSPETLKGLYYLKKLNIRNNKISLLAEHTFDSLNYLEEINLAGNELQIISGYEFMSMSKLLTIHFANNPWSCDCDYLTDMKNFTLANAEKIVDFQDVGCFTFNDSVDTVVMYKVADLQLPEFCLNETIIFNHTRQETIKETLDKTAISVMVTILTLFVLGMIIFGLAFWNRDFIKVWCFVKFGWKFQAAEDDNDKDRLYDAFVSYSSNDEQFVLRELVPHLEDRKDGRECFRLCVHYRDFAVGASIAESIISAVKCSRRVIIVLSDNFLSSEWCQYEFQTAHHQLLEERKNRIIMIVLHDIKQDMLDQQLKDYMKTRTYVTYGDPWFWPKIEYAMPKLKNSPQAVPIDNPVVPDIIPKRHFVREDSVASDISDNMQYILDNMKNYEAVEPKRFEAEIELQL